MGAGKTSVGREVASRLGWRLSDSDEEIQKATGKSVRELAVDPGVEAMHELESQHVLKALGEDQASVICAAASVIDDARCREALVTPTVIAVWLRATPATLANRFRSAGHRPAYGDDPETFLAQQSAARSALFEKVSDATIDVDDLGIAAVADAVCTLLDQSKSGRRQSSPST